MERRRRPLDLAVGVEELDREVARLLRDPVERVDEVHVPRRAAELAVGRRAEADVLLHADGRADRLVLDPAQLGRVDAAGGEVLARLQEPRGPEEAADVVGAERRGLARRHRLCIPRVGRPSRACEHAMIAAVSDPADLGVQESADLLRAARPLGAGARRGLPRADPGAGRRAQPPRRPRLDQRVGARLRGGRAGRGRARGRAARARRRASPLRRPDRAEGPLRGRGQARSPRRAACSTRSRTATPTPGRGSRPREWSCSGICTRTSSPPGGRPTRSATPGRSTVRPAVRAAAPGRRSPRGRRRRRRAPTRRARCASRRRCAAPRP